MCCGRGDIDACCALVSRLRRAGVKLGWNPLATPAMPQAAGRPDFMPLPPAASPDTEAWRQALDQAVARWPDMPLLALELPGVDVMEALLGPPLLWAACALGSCSEPARAQALPPQAQRALRLLNRLLHDEDHASVVEDIKADAALSLRLLQYLNSAGALPGRELDSIEQAVMLLGRDALYRWVAQMLVRMSPPRPAAHALQATALARARLFELLARASGDPTRRAYLLGLATMLPLLLQCRIDEAADDASAARGGAGAAPAGRPVAALPRAVAGAGGGDLPATDAASAPWQPGARARLLGGGLALDLRAPGARVGAFSPREGPADACDRRRRRHCRSGCSVPAARTGPRGGAAGKGRRARRPLPIGILARPVAGDRRLRLPRQRDQPDRTGHKARPVHARPVERPDGRAPLERAGQAP